MLQPRKAREAQVNCLWLLLVASGIKKFVAFTFISFFFSTISRLLRYVCVTARAEYETEGEWKGAVGQCEGDIK